MPRLRPGPRTARPRPASRAGVGASPGEARPARDALPPQKGPTHAAAGAVVLLLGLLVAFLGNRSADVEERRVAWLGGSVVVLLGLGFVRLGVRGWWTHRQARRRATRASEAWLRDRAWSREGARPVAAERALPALGAALVLTAWLAPFHTVWRVSLAWWGFWLVLVVLDLLLVLTLGTAAVRVWRALRAGRCRLRWHDVPVRPGGTFAARFESGRELGGELAATLRCVRDPAGDRRIGDEASPAAEEIWSDTRRFRLHERPEGGSWAQLSFPVPDDALGTSSHARRPVRWLVRVRVPTAGPDFETAFPVPIYR